jgi:putative ABC transport system permease protein
MIPLSYNVRSLTVRKVSSLAAVLGIALVVAVFAAANMLSAGIKETLGSSGSSSNAIILRQGSDAEIASGIEEPQVGLLLAKEQVARAASGGALGVAEVVVVVTLDKKGTDGVSNVLVRGVPAHVYDFRPEVKLVAGRKAQPGTDEVVIGKAIRGRFVGVDLGGSFDLKKNRPVTVVGVFESGGSSFESEVWADLDTARTTFGRQGMVSSVRVRLDSPSKFDAFKADVEGDKKLGLAVEREDKFYEKASQGMATLLGGLGVFIAIVFSLGAMIGAAITMYGQVSNRAHEVGTLRALGFSRLSILSSFLIESLMLAIAGGVLGAVASLLMGLVKFSMINFTSWSEVVFRFTATPDIIVSSLFFAGFMGLLGGFLPALRAAYISPIEAMRN